MIFKCWICQSFKFRSGKMYTIEIVGNGAYKPVRKHVCEQCLPALQVFELGASQSDNDPVK